MTPVTAAKLTRKSKSTTGSVKLVGTKRTASVEEEKEDHQSVAEFAVPELIEPSSTKRQKLADATTTMLDIVTHAAQDIDMIVESATVAPTRQILDDTQMSECCTEKNNKLFDMQSSISVKDNISELSAGIKIVALTDMAALKKLKELEESTESIMESA